MIQTPIPITFNDVVKNPFTYLLITIVGLLFYFVYSNTDINKQNDADCKKDNTELRAENKELRKDKDNLVNAILVKNGIIGKLTTVTDSLNNKINNEH
jgi:hypothetical protein